MRWASEEVPQVAYAVFAAATAASTSSAEASATCVVTAPVAGSVTGPYWPDVPSTVLPPIQWLTVFVMTYSFRLLAAQAVRAASGGLHRWRRRAATCRSYSSRALTAAGRLAVSATGTSHHACAGGGPDTVSGVSVST
ncbi:Uncharacterised protein [Streptomyces griseus]|nr:Uncharacterised protein [Streptomyces griseus]